MSGVVGPVGLLFLACCRCISSIICVFSFICHNLVIIDLLHIVDEVPDVVEDLVEVRVGVQQVALDGLVVVHYHNEEVVVLVDVFVQLAHHLVIDLLGLHARHFPKFSCNVSPHCITEMFLDLFLFVVKSRVLADVVDGLDYGFMEVLVDALKEIIQGVVSSFSLPSQVGGSRSLFRRVEPTPLQQQELMPSLQLSHQDPSPL